MKKVQIVTDVPRRRRFTDEFKAEVLAEIASGSSTLAETARKHDLAQSLLHHWRKQAAKDSPFVKIVASSTEEVHPNPILLNLPMRITSPHGVVLEVGSPIALEHVIYLVRRIGERT
jgi:hypothetical protein